MERVPGSAPASTGAGNQVGQVKEQARHQTRQLSAQARQQASELANRGGEQVKSQLASQKHNAAQRMTPVQAALRETGQQLRNQGQGPVADYADKAADQLERFAGYLRENDVDRLLNDARGFARGNPAVFLGSAAALGFLATRFLKSSSEEAYSADYGYYRPTPTATSSARVTHGTEEPTTALPPSDLDVEPPPTAGTPPLSDRGPTEPPRDPRGR